jgi:hypothetical protein
MVRFGLRQVPGMGSIATENTIQKSGIGFVGSDAAGAGRTRLLSPSEAKDLMGVTGADGDSAYEVAVDQGFVGWS